jgi:hypothetical protein
MKCEPQWMTDELLEQWANEARTGNTCSGAPPRWYAHVEKVLALISALRAARANQATEAGRALVLAVDANRAACPSSYREHPWSGDSWSGVVRAHNAILAEREAAKPKPKWRANGNVLEREGQPFVCFDIAAQARAVADALNREAALGGTLGGDRG